MLTAGIHCLPERATYWDGEKSWFDNMALNVQFYISFVSAVPPCIVDAPMVQKPPADTASGLLPVSYRGFRNLQEEFQRYQDAAFPKRPPRFFALELAGETGELANLEKKVWKGREVADADFVDEAADVCIALINFANSRGIDLSAAVEAKMARIDRRRADQPEIESHPEDEL